VRRVAAALAVEVALGVAPRPVSRTRWSAGPSPKSGAAIGSAVARARSSGLLESERTGAVASRRASAAACLGPSVLQPSLTFVRR